MFFFLFFNGHNHTSRYLNFTDLTECRLLQPAHILGQSVYGGENYYRSVLADDPENCQRACMDDHACIAVSFTRRQFDDNRCLLYKRGQFNTREEAHSELWIKHCPRGWYLRYFITKTRPCNIHRIFHH